ncbi:MAG: SulP family inorganic anion transporter [Actinomycetota bacterium]
MGRLLPRLSDYRGLRASWRRDIVAGLTVAVVALPLALAFGVTSGVGASAGLATAIVAGVVAAIFGGSGLQVSGPTGAMTVVLVPLVARHGPSSVYLVAVLAGLIVLIAGIARVGRLLAYMPWPVVEGFTAGIAIVIFLQQVPSAVGVTKPGGENVVVVAARAVLAIDGRRSAAAIALTVATVMLIPALTRLHRGLPAGLIAVAASTAASVVLDLDVARIGALPSGLPAPSLPDLSAAGSILTSAMAIAALAAIESLLSAKVADGMSDLEPHDPDRELVGQGLANIASGLFGGMPATGAIARTAVNARSGARTRLASAVHSVVLALFVLVGSSIVGHIPVAVLAGVLFVTAIRMAERHNILSVIRSTRSDAIVLVVTAAVTVAFDLVVAVEVGIVLAGFLALRHVALTATVEAQTATELEIGADTEHALLDEHILTYRLDGALFFGAAQRFLTEMTAIADVRVVILRLSRIQVLDATGAQTLGQIVQRLQQHGTKVLLQGLRPSHERVLHAVGALDLLTREHHLFATIDEAVDHARSHCRRDLGPSEVSTVNA